MKNSEIIKFVPNHLKKYAIKKLPFVTRSVPNKYKTKKMCNKAILENCGMLVSVPNQYKAQ